MSYFLQDDIARIKRKYRCESLSLKRVEYDIRDSIVHFIKMLHTKTDIEINKIIQMTGIHQSKFCNCLERLCKPDFHNCRLSKANWFLLYCLAV